MTTGDSAARGAPGDGSAFTRDSHGSVWHPGEISHIVQPILASRSLFFGNFTMPQTNDFRFISYYLDRPICTGRVYDIFQPETPLHDTAIFMIHGGGYNGGSRSQNFHCLMEHFCNLGYIVASTDYRLDCTMTYKLADVRSSYMHFCNYLQEQGRPVKVAIFGSSAGAALGSLMLYAKPGECGEANDFTGEWRPPSCGLFTGCPLSFEPWKDIFPAAWQVMKNAVGTPYEQNPQLYRNLSLDRLVRPGNPPIFFLVAGREHIYFPEDTLEFAHKIAATGSLVTVKVYPNVEHGFIYSLARWQQREAVGDMVKYIEHEKIDELAFSNRPIDQ